MPARPSHKPCVNLADPARGGAVIRVSDEFFAPAKRMLSAEEPRFDPILFDLNGKWMDGWESRRKRDEGHDSCVFRICPGIIYGLDIDTRNFTGNFAPAASLEACRVELDPDRNQKWTEILPLTPLEGDSHHYLAISSREVWTHLRLNIYPDGGVARIRVYGTTDGQTEDQLDEESLVNLSCAERGAVALFCNDMHFGHMRNILQPQPPSGMADGWETRRRRTPGNDWVIIQLAEPGEVRAVEVDTAFFKGNNPARCCLLGAMISDGQGLDDESVEWSLILPQVALGPDQFHRFDHVVRKVGNVNHVRFEIHPDGGVARLRLLGVPGPGQS